VVLQLTVARIPVEGAAKPRAEPVSEQGSNHEKRMPSLS
jgi:hypothetical protein